MNGTLFWADGQKGTAGLVLEISIKSHDCTIIADALLPAGTRPPLTATRLTAECGGKTMHVTVIRAEITAANTSFVRMRIDARQQKALPSPQR